jgi:hypothetical protein
MLSSLSSPLRLLPNRLVAISNKSHHAIRLLSTSSPSSSSSSASPSASPLFITSNSTAARRTNTVQQQRRLPIIQTSSSSSSSSSLFPSSISSGSSSSSSSSSSGRYFTTSATTTTESPSSLDPNEIQKRLNEFQDLFVEARMCIDDLKDSVDTVYYDDDADEAKEATDAAIEYFEKLCSEITNLEEKNKVLRGNGLKVEQLKGELELTLNGGH